MGIKFGSIQKKLSQAYSVADQLGLIKKDKKSKAAIEQDPSTVINKQKGTKAVNITTFPEDVGNRYFTMRFKEYTYNASTYANGSPSVYTSDVIILPMPEMLGEKYNVDYGAEELGGITGGLLERGLGSVDELSAENRQELNAAGLLSDTASSGAAVGAGRIAGAVARMTADFIGAQGVENAIGIATGVVENPNTRALFKSVQLRNLSFSWKLAPRNANELANIRLIINTIRARMHPKISSLASLPVAFEFPDIVEIGFQNTMRDVPFKPAAVMSLDVDMSPEGVSLFQGVGEPTTYTLRLQLMELEQFTREDFE